MSSRRDVDTVFSTPGAEQTAVGDPAVNLGPLPDATRSFGQDNLSGIPTTPVQYAELDPEKQRLYVASNDTGHNTTSLPSESSSSLWIPIPLRTWFWVTYVCVLFAGAIGLEVALHYSHKNGGWPTMRNADRGVLHYVFTLPPVGVAMILVGLWAWTDLEVKRLQPYVDLLHGDSPPQRSLLLDYTRTHNALVWVKASTNRHYIVALASIMALLALSFQPVSAALFSLRDVYERLPDTTVNNLRTISLSTDEQVQDLTGYLAASGFASASAVYGLGEPAFVHEGYTVGKLELPLQLATNGTMKVNTTAIFTDPGCRNPDKPVTMTIRPDGVVNTSTTFSGCQVFWHADNRSVNFFAAETISNCTAFNTSDVPFAPAIFWFYAWSPNPMTSVTLCVPKITLLNVEASIDLGSSNLTDVRVLSNLTVGQDPLTQYAGNITGAPIYGRAYNGLNWTSLGTDPLVAARAGAVQLQLPAAAFQSAVQSPTGLTAAFVNNTFASLSADVYRKYLSILASVLYFVDVPQPQPMTVTVFTYQKRLFLADAAVHVLSVGMLLLAVFGTLVHLAHREERRGLRLLHQPGTLASAAALTAQTPMAELLIGKQGPEDMNEALKRHRFRIDPRRNKIVTEGEAGYQDAVSPPGWRRSFFGAVFHGEGSSNGDAAPGPRP